jgi:hypothetical protein
MRTTITRIVIGLVLLCFAACGDKHKQPPINNEAFNPQEDLKDKKATAPKLPKPPPPK